MFEGWQDYYLLIGSAAAALIGLLFVVATLTVGRDYSTIERGQKLYMTPIVFHLGGIVLLSGAAMSPVTTPAPYALASGAVAVIGFIGCVRIAHGIRTGPLAPTSDFDMVWYGIVPAAAYLLLLAASGLLALRPSEAALAAVGAMLMAQLLISIHSAWDLVTYLAPRSQDPGSPKDENKKP